MTDTVTIGLMLFGVLYASIELFKNINDEGVFGQAMKSFFFFISVLTTLGCIDFGIVVAQTQFGSGNAYTGILNPFLLILLWCLIGCFLVFFVQLLFSVWTLVYSTWKRMTANG